VSDEVLIIEARGDALSRAGKWIAERDSILEKAAIVTAVDSRERLEASGTVQTAIAKHIKALDKERKSVTEPLDAVKKQIMAQEKELAANLTRELARLKAMNDAYATQLAAEAEAERRRIAEEERRAAMEAADRAAKAKAIFGESVSVRTPEPTPQPVAPPEKVALAGSRTVKRWEFAIFDTSMVPSDYLVVDEARVRAHIKNAEAMGRNPDIPGIRFTSKISVESK
jgi:hypothetical protein